MNTAYYILLISTLVFPFVGLFASRKISVAISASVVKPVLLFFLFHNICFFLGFSLRGDYIDYGIFSLEYLVFCFVVFRLFKNRNPYARIARILGLIAIVSVFLIGLPGVLGFIMVSQDLAPNEVFRFTDHGKTYETRRYSSEFDIIPGTRYTFDTYRTFNYLLLERKIDQTDFFEARTKLNIGEKRLHIQIQQDGNKIVFLSTNGNSFTKSLR
jgi:hypothetical protein